MRTVAIKSAVNEVGRLVIELGRNILDDVTVDQYERYPLAEARIWLSKEIDPGADAASAVWKVFEPSNPLLPTWQKFGTLCSAKGPAVAAEFGRRHVYGRKVKAEEYIALWRSADKLTLAQTVVKGLIVVAELERNLEPLRKDCDNSYYRQENSKALARLQTLATCAESQHYLVSVNESVQKWRLPIIDLATYRLFRELRGTRWQGDDGGGDVCSCAVVGGLKESDAPGAEHTVAQEARGAVRDLFESEACCEL